MNTQLMYGLEWVAKMHFMQDDKPMQENEREILEEKARDKVIAFVESGAMSETPSNILAASMFAALSRKAAAGQKKLPDEGMGTDIRVV